MNISTRRRRPSTLNTQHPSSPTAADGAPSKRTKSMAIQLSSHTPRSFIDPFSSEYLADPYPFHHELRETGSAVWLEKHSTWVVARYHDVLHVLNNSETYCSNRGVGL